MNILLQTEMKLQPLVSIIINNYNYERFLPEAIDSALNQTYKQIEVIVVDDASTDNSHKVIEGYGEQVIKVFREENGKQGAALNDGFAVSKGEIVVFLDADDYLFPQAVKRIVNVWQPGISKVHYRLEVVDGARQPLGYSYPQGSKPLAKGEVWRELLEFGSYAGTSMSGNAISHQALERVFPIPDKYKLTADDYLSTLIPFYGEVAAVEEPLAAYRIHDNNQWALNTITGDRFRRFIKHDLVTNDLIISKAKELRYELPRDFELRSPDRFWVRLISLRMEPHKHPISFDSRFYLVYSGIYSLCKYSRFNWIKRTAFCWWLFFIGLFPLSLTKFTIVWFYMPMLRPKWIFLIFSKNQRSGKASH